MTEKERNLLYFAHVSAIMETKGAMPFFKTKGVVVCKRITARKH